MAQAPTSAAAKAGAILGLLLSLPVLGLAWILALGAMSYGIPSGSGQMALPLAREFIIWGLVEAGVGTLCLICGGYEWAAGRIRSASWFLWTPVLLAVVSLMALGVYILFLIETGPRR